MIEINSRIRHEREGEWLCLDRHPKFSHSTWGGIAAAVVGGGLSLYGANKQKQAQEDANKANQASIGQADVSAWQGYLASRGVNPSGVSQFGQIPTNIQAINTKLPLWANVKMNPAAVTARSGGAPVSTTNRRATGFKNGQLIFS
jgi:hypothetical protein